MNILLAVCGSISAYRTLDLVRDFTKKGHRVRVILTRGAEEFVVSRVFRYLGAEEVYRSGDDFEFPKNMAEAPVLHVDLAKWTDRFVIAPLSANTLSRLVRGEASDLLTSVFLAIPGEKPILVFPAMNTNMLKHPFVKENFSGLQKLKSLPQLLLHPTDKGELACGDIGEGKLSKIETISELTECFSNLEVQKTLLLTAGATLAPLDSVRYLTNPSSGKTSYYLAKEALSRGFKVQVVAGKNATSLFDHLNFHPRFSIERVVTTEQMYQSVMNLSEQFDYYISPAAISDIKFDPADGKLKKENIKNSLPITRDKDVLESILEKRKKHQRIVGFAAETDLSREMLQKKYAGKPVDLLVGTLVNSGANGKEQKGFELDEAEYLFLENGVDYSSLHLSKKELAKQILMRLH